MCDEKEKELQDRAQMVRWAYAFVNVYALITISCLTLFRNSVSDKLNESVPSMPRYLVFSKTNYFSTLTWMFDEAATRSREEQ